MVLALLVMGLGCSEEPREPPPTTTAAPTTTTTVPTPRSEQWSHQARQPFVDGCVDGTVATAAMAERGVTTRDVCRCLLYELERQLSESDFQLLSDEERVDAYGQVSTVCREKLLGD